MYLSLSVRIAEAPSKDRMTIPFADFARLTQATGYRAICLRASAGGVQTPHGELRSMRQLLDSLGLSVSMVTTDFDVPLNNERGPLNLREIGPHLDVAEIFGATLIRVCLKTEDDIAHAARAADAARERGIRLAHQCHTDSLFERLDDMLDVLGRIGRENFGVIYEPANLLLCGQPYDRSAIRRLSPYLMNVYLQNHRLAPDGDSQLATRCRGTVVFHDIPLWQPGVDFNEVVAGLREIGYDGAVTVHQAFARLMGPREAAAQSHAFLARIMSSADPGKDEPHEVPVHRSSGGPP